MPNGHAPILAPALEENTSGTDDALDDFKITAYESAGFLYEVGFRWIVNPDDDEFDEDTDDGADVRTGSLQWIAKRLNELEWI